MDNSDRPDRAPAAPPESTSAPDDDDDDTRATDNTNRPDRTAGPPGIGAPPSTPETDDEPERAAGPPGIGAPPPNAEDLGPALTGDLDPGLTPGQSESLAEGAAVMQGSTFAGTVTTIGAGMARGFGMGFGGVYATGGPPSAATPFPHDDAVVAAGAAIVGAGAAIYGGYQAYQSLTELPFTAPVLNEKPEETPEATPEQPTRPADRPGKIASETGLTEKEVRERIHGAKGNMPQGGDVRNPDVVVDLDTGEIHPKNKDGTYGDSIGNIFDE